MAKNFESYESLGLEQSIHNSLIRVFEDYQGRHVVGIQRGSDHQPLIKVLYPLYLQRSEVSVPDLNFSPVDQEVMPVEIRIKVVMVYNANKRVKDEYIKSCSKIYKGRKTLQMVGDNDND